MPRSIAILGGGPIGLEAALYARRLGHNVLIFDRGDIASNIADWNFVRLFTPWHMNTTALGLKASGADLPLDHCPTGGEFRRRYLVPLALSEPLSGCVRERTTVLAVGREGFSKSEAIGKSARAASPFRILVRDAAGGERIESSDIVLDCTGTYGHHRLAGRGGIPAAGELPLHDRIAYTIPDVLGRDRPRYADKHTLLIGAGFSAATVLRDFQELIPHAPRTRITWAIRRPGAAMHLLADDPLPERRGLVRRMLDMLASPPPWLQFLGSASMEQVTYDGESFGVTLDSSGARLALTADNLISLVGYSPDTSIYEQLQVHTCYATAGPIKLAAALLGEGASDCLSAGSSLGPDTLKNPEPNFFILGAKSYGTNSSFLLRVGHRQIRDAFRLIEDNSGLDLYE